MARRRKQVYDPNQLSLLDYVANKPEQIREENIQADLAEAKQEQTAPVTQPENTEQVSKEVIQPETTVSAPVQRPFPFPTNDTSTMRLLGRNKQGASMYSMGDGIRLPSKIFYCPDLSIFPVISIGNHETPSREG